MVMLFVAKQIKFLIFPKTKTIKYILLYSTSFYFVISSFILLYYFVYLNIFHLRVP
jgi:hypothetical protein